MKRVSLKLSFVTVFIYFIIQYQVGFASAFTDNIVDGLAKTTSIFTNTLSNLNTAVALTDVGTSLGDTALNVVTWGRLQDASSYVTFLFFSRDSGEAYTEVKVGDSDTLLEAGFDVSKPTKFVIHGWTNNGTDDFATNMTKAFLDAEDLNVISVNWPGFARGMYSVAYTAVPYVAAYTASFVDYLVETVGVKLANIHIIGYSLGAHIAGITGESVTCGKLPRITGLDPAGPLFTKSTNGSLDASDAEFVDVIHTTAGTVGYADPCGTVDFYPNGGYAPQAGCSAVDASCSHGRAYLFFAESLTSDDFIATKCDGWRSYTRGECDDNERVVMGYHVDKRSQGVFYLETNSESPYAKGA